MLKCQRYFRPKAPHIPIFSLLTAFYPQFGSKVHFLSEKLPNFSKKASSAPSFLEKKINFKRPTLSGDDGDPLASAGEP